MASGTYLEAIREALAEEMDADPSVFLLGEDIGLYGGAFKVTEGFLARFGAERVIDTPIAESGIVGAAIGAALLGMRPVAEMQFIDFMACAYDQIVNFAAKMHWRTGLAVPIVIRGPSGGGVHGGPFHSQNPEVAYAHTPGLKVVQPSTAADAKGLLKAAIRDPDPVIFLEHKLLYRHPRLKEELPGPDHLVPIGRAAVRREGCDLTLLTYGAMTLTCLDAADELDRAGASVEVLDLRTLAPLDRAAIAGSVRKTGRALVVHEDTRSGGLAGEIAALINEDVFEWLDAPVRRVTAPDTPVPYAASLEKAFLPDVERVTVAARALLDW